MKTRYSFTRLIGTILVATLVASLSWGQALIPMAYWGSKKGTLVISTSAQTLAWGLCSGALTVQTRNMAGSVANVIANLTVNLAGTNGLIFYSDDTCTNSIASTIVLSGTSSITIYFSGASVGTSDIRLTATNYNEAVQTETFSINNFIWTGGGGNSNWNTGGNWSGGSAPGAANVAVFTSGCGANCNATINVSPGNGGIRMLADYTGTVTQGSGVVTTFGSSGFAMLAGTFTGSNAALTSNGSFGASGGTFTPPAANWTVAGQFTVSNTPTFNAGTSHLILNGNTTTYMRPGSWQFYDFTIPSISAYQTIDLAGGTLVVNHTLNLPSGGWAGHAPYINNGNITINGNINSTGHGMAGTALVTVAGNVAGQTLTGSADATIMNLTINSGANPVTISGAWKIINSYTYTAGAGSLTTTGSTLTFYAPSTASATLSPGTVTYNNVGFSNGSYRTTYNGGNSIMTVAGNLTFSPSGWGSILANNITFNVGGNLAANSEGAGGTNSFIKLIGNASGQTISGGGNVPKLEIDTGANPVTLSGGISISENYKVTSAGVFTTTGSTISFAGAPVTISPGLETYNNVTFPDYQSFSYTVDLSGKTLLMSGALTISFGAWRGSPQPMNNGSIQTTGNVSVTSYGNNGTASIILAGNVGGQTVSGSIADSWVPNLSLATGGNSITFSGTAINTGATAVTSGNSTLSGIGTTFNTTTLALGGTTLTKSSGTVRVGGAIIGTGALFGGTVNP